jgi:hypothetical protein
MMWLRECPFVWDQGLVRPLVTESGTVVLMCDSCDTVWCSPSDIDAELYHEPQAPDWAACDTHVKPGTTRWATVADVTKAGWADLEWHEGDI